MFYTIITWVRLERVISTQMCIAQRNEMERWKTKYIGILDIDR